MSKLDTLSMASEIWPSSKMCQIIFLSKKFRGCAVFLRSDTHPCHHESQHLLRSARPGEEAGSGGKMSNHHVPGDHMI